ncbi:MAG: hypothetical protein ACRDXE_10575 [Acidimicrobiales bacterium]
MTRTDLLGPPSPTCPDCGAAIGAEHRETCDVARCLATGGQRLMCGVAVIAFGAGATADVLFVAAEPHDCGYDTWTGYWPGDAECAEYGWWVTMASVRNSADGFVRTTDDDPDRTPDLNRIPLECTWDPGARRWVRRP